MGAIEVTEQAGVGLPRRLLRGAVSALWFGAAVLLGAVLWPSSLGGCTTLTIVSGKSMEPTYYTGDLVVARCGAVEVGDAIVYQPTDTGGARVIHRIIGGSEAAGWTMQGDNNDFIDPWTPQGEEVLGRAVLHLPHVGKFASILLSPLTWISLLVVALAVVIWPGKESEQDESPATDVDDISSDGPADGPDVDLPDAADGPDVDLPDTADGGPRASLGEPEGTTAQAV